MVPRPFDFAPWTTAFVLVQTLALRPQSRKRIHSS